MLNLRVQRKRNHVDVSLAFDVVVGHQMCERASCDSEKDLLVCIGYLSEKNFMYCWIRISFSQWSDSNAGTERTKSQKLLICFEHLVVEEVMMTQTPSISLLFDCCEESDNETINKNKCSLLSSQSRFTKTSQRHRTNFDSVL